MINQNIYNPSYLELLDVFGLKFNFKVDGSENLKTRFGSFLTIFYSLFTIALFLSFGVDLYQRKNPRVIHNSKIFPKEEINLSNQNFTLAFRVQDNAVKLVVNDSLFSMEAIYFQYKKNENEVWEPNKVKYLNYRLCQEENSTKEKEEFYNFSLSSWFCLDFENINLGGNWDGDFVNGIIINTKQCQYSKNNSCLRDEDLKKSYKNEKLLGSNFYFSFMYMEALPQMNNYENPIKLHLINKYDALSLKATKINEVFFKKVNIKDDKGWFFSNLDEQNFISSDNLRSDFSFKDEFNQDLLYSCFFYFGKKVDEYTRSYMKIQEVIANMGGFSKIFYAFLNYLYLIFGKYFKNIYLIKRIEFDVKDDLGILNEKNKFNLKSFRNLILQSSQENFFRKSNNEDKNNIYKNDNLANIINLLNPNENRRLELNNQSFPNKIKINNSFNLNSNIHDKSLKTNLNPEFKNNPGIESIYKKEQNNKNKQNDHLRYSQEKLKINPNGLIKPTKMTIIGINNNQSDNMSKRLGDSSNLEYLNQEVKDENNLNLKNLNKENLKNKYVRRSKKAPIIPKLKQEISKNKFENEKNKISVMKLFCSNLLNLKKGSIRDNFRLHYYKFFEEYSDNKLNVLNYFQTLNDFQNIKEIIIEGKSTEFSNLKPTIEIRDSGINFEVEKLKINANRNNNFRFDRILENLLEKLRKNEN